MYLGPMSMVNVWLNQKRKLIAEGQCDARLSVHDLAKDLQMSLSAATDLVFNLHEMDQVELDPKFPSVPMFGFLGTGIARRKVFSF